MGTGHGKPMPLFVTMEDTPMRTLLTLALLVSVVAPVSAQRAARRGTYRQGVIVSAPGTYVQPRLAYSYSPAQSQNYSTMTYSQPSYGTPIYSTTQNYTVPTYSYQTSVVYSSPTYSTPVTTYSQPT